MSLFDIFTKKKKTEPEPKHPRESDEPWVNVVNTEFDTGNPKQGFMELEWNKAFINFLREHGYTGNTDEDLVDKWFTDLCKNIGGQIDEESKFVADTAKLPKRRKKS